MPNSRPYYPNEPLTYGSLYWFIKTTRYSINPFDKDSIEEGKARIMRQANKISPSHKKFLHAATLATGLSERTIKKYTYEVKVDD